MMKLRLLIVSLLLLVTPVFAQDTPTHNLSDEELALVEELQAVYENFKVLEAIGIDVTQAVEQTMEFNGETMPQSFTIVMETDSILSEGQTVAFSADIFQSVEADFLTGDLGMSMIYVDEALYINITSEDGVFEGLLPTGWYNVDETPEFQSLVGNIDLESMNNQFEMQFSPELVESIAEVDVPDDLEIDAERAIYVSLLPQALKEQGFAEELANGLFASDSAEFEQLLNALLDNATMELTYYLDADGGLLAVDMVMSVSGDLSEIVGVEGFLLDQTLYQSAVYRYHDETPVITAPETE